MHMTIVTSWSDLIDEVAEKFPKVDTEAVYHQHGDMDALVQQVAKAHDLTLSEAAEVVAYRLPQYLEPERLSA